MDIETIGNSVGNDAVKKPVKVQVQSQQPPNVRVDESAYAGLEKNPDNAEKNGDAERQFSESTVREAVSSANSRLNSTRCEFSYHKGTRRVSIKVFDKESDEIIREIPPEKSLEMLQKMWELAGLFVDKKQ